MRVDRHLRALLREELAGGLPPHFALAGRRREPEADAGRAEIDLDDAHVDRSWRRRGPINVGDPDKRRRHRRVLRDVKGLKVRRERQETRQHEPVDAGCLDAALQLH